MQPLCRAGQRSAAAIFLCALRSVSALSSVPSACGVSRGAVWSDARAAAWSGPLTAENALPREETVDDENNGVRLTFAALAAFADEFNSANAANTAAQKGRLLVNGVARNGGYKVERGDLLSLACNDKARRTASSASSASFAVALCERGLTVLYEDEDCAVVHKPPGVHTVPWLATLKRREKTLCDALSYVLSAPAPETPMRLASPWPAHRLDARVSGCVLVAKTKPALAFLCASFAKREVEKTYVAIVAGEPSQHQGQLEPALAADQEKARGEIATPVDGRTALTRFVRTETTPCAVYGTLSTLDLSPLTGRRHQLRIHCARDLGTPIVGDDLYHELARDDAPRKSAGLYLHARHVRFRRPSDALELEVEAPLPPKFARLLARARKGSESEWQKHETKTDSH